MKKYILYIILLLMCSNSFSQNYVWNRVDTVPGKYVKIKSISSCDSLNILTFSDQSNYGAILRLTTDGGKTWNKIYSDTIKGTMETGLIFPPHYANLNFVTKSLISISYDKNKVLLSKDLFTSYDIMVFDSNTWQSLVMFDENHGFRREIISGTALWNIYYTKDGAKSWEKLKVPDRYTWIQFMYKVVDKNNIYLYAYDEDRGRFFIRCNNLNEWEEYDMNSFPDVTDFVFPSKNVGYMLLMVGGQRQCIIKTIDGGKTWFYVLNRTKENYNIGIVVIDFFDENNGIVCGNNIGTFLRTTDGGVTWLNDDVDSFLKKPTASFYPSGITMNDINQGFLIENMTSTIHKLEPKTTYIEFDNTGLGKSITIAKTTNNLIEINKLLDINIENIEVFNYIGKKIGFNNLNGNTTSNIINIELNELIYPSPFWVVLNTSKGTFIQKFISD